MSALERAAVILEIVFCAAWEVAAYFFDRGMVSKKEKGAGKGKQPANKPAIAEIPEDPSDDEFKDPVNYAIIQCLEALVIKRGGPASQTVNSVWGGSEYSIWLIVPFRNRCWQIW